MDLEYYLPKVAAAPPAWNSRSQPDVNFSLSMALTLAPRKEMATLDTATASLGIASCCVMIHWSVFVFVFCY